MTARIVQEVTTPTVLYSGFPSNMGENGVKMTLGGRVTYEDVAAAKAAIDKYDGVDMGLGTTLELQACEQRSGLTPHQHGTTMWCAWRGNRARWGSVCRDH